MRSDMHEVLVERPRAYRGCHGRSGCHYPRQALARARSLEDLPSKEAMGALYAEKSLNENLAPLRRFLQRCVGRPWSRVYAEIRAQVNGASAVQMHILQHLADYVELHAVEIDGVLHGSMRWGKLAPLSTLSRSRLALYVCPRTGILRKVARPQASKAAPHPDFRRRSDLGWWMRRPGGWFEITLAPLPPWGAPRNHLVDVVSRATVGSHDHHVAYTGLGVPWGGSHYATAVRQLGKREIRAFFEKR